MARMGSQRLVPRLRVGGLLEGSSTEFTADGTHGVTGGLGGLGLRVATLLLENAGAVFLASRSGRVTRSGQGSEQVRSPLGPSLDV